MKNSKYGALLPWLLFASAFLVPQLFLLFVPFAAVTAYRIFISEYGEVFEYWRARFRRFSHLCDREYQSKTEPPRLKAAAEMV